MSRRRLLTLAAALLCLTVLAGAAGLNRAWAVNVNLMAVNDRVLDVTVENMPRAVGGVLYVPYTMLSYQATGINLGVNAMYSITRRTVLVTDGQKGVTFDTQANTAEDMDGVSVSARAMVRNATVFLPIDWLCEYFGSISCTRIQTPYGTVIRVTGPSAVLSDQSFAGAAGPQLSTALRGYQDSAAQAQPSTPSEPPPTASPDPLPTASPEATPPPSGGSLYLACRWSPEVQDCAQTLESRGLRALFLLTPQQAAQEGGTVRRLAAAGHTIGLVLDGDSSEDCLEQAGEGRRLLAAAARCRALIVSAPGLEGGCEALEEAGFVIWAPTISGDDFSSGAALVRGLNPRRADRVEVDGSLAFLRGALNAMEEENCQVCQPTAPEL